MDQPMIEDTQGPEEEDGPSQGDAYDATKERLNDERRTVLVRRGIEQEPAGYPRSQTKEANGDVDTGERSEK